MLSYGIYVIQMYNIFRIVNNFKCSFVSFLTMQLNIQAAYAENFFYVVIISYITKFQLINIYFTVI